MPLATASFEDSYCSSQNQSSHASPFDHILPQSVSVEPQEGTAKNADEIMKVDETQPRKSVSAKVLANLPPTPDGVSGAFTSATTLQNHPLTLSKLHEFEEAA